MDGAGAPRDLASLLLAAGKLTPSALERAQRARAQSGESLALVLTRLGLLAESELADALSQALGLERATVRDVPAEPVLADRLSARFLKRMRLLPLAAGERLIVAMADPTDDASAHALEVVAGKPVERRVGLATEIDAALDRLYGGNTGDVPRGVRSSAETSDDDLDRLKDLASEAPVVRQVNQLIAEAVDAGASDIHVEPTADHLRVRYRIDGVLRDVEARPLDLAAAIVSRIKIMAKLNIAERRLPQDERIRLPVRGQDIDFRVSTMPTIHGESVVLRILDQGKLELDFAALGLDERRLARYLDVLDRPHGILLVTGPVGSGKTTTLYASLQHLNSPAKKIITVENPIEYQIDGINQIQVKPQIDLTFASALRAILRHDFDILMVGEIRDAETVQSAIQASLMGRLVLSTLHTNDAASAVARLLNMGAEDYLLASTVSGIVAQRLVRRLCADCAEAYQPDPALVRSLGLDRLARGAPIMLQHARGCAACSSSGYRGRTSILEILVMSDRIREFVLKRATAREIHLAAVDEGMATMFEHGLEKALAGANTIEEVARVTRES